MIKQLGDGTFGRVLEVRHILTNKIYAMKVIRAVERFVDAAYVTLLKLDRRGHLREDIGALGQSTDCGEVSV